MAIDLSPEALAQVRENAAYGDPWDDDFVLALIDALEAARAEIDHLKYERQEIIDNALEELEGARAALQPFAKLAGPLVDQGATTAIGLTDADFSRARAALDGEPTP
jgi:hypothetical protein